MASEMLQFVVKRGRAYHYVPCAYVENKSRTTLHFYNKHVLEHEIPYACVQCEFKTGDRKKLDRHLESPNHREKVDLQMESLSVLVLQTPRFIQEGKDMVKLSKENSAGHWMGLSQVMGNDGAEGSPSRLEDLRGQLLRTEPMVLTPPEPGEGSRG